MLKISFALLTLFMFLFLMNSFGQKMLVFDKKGKVKRIRYLEGDLINIELKDGQGISGKIKEIRDHSIIIQLKEVPLNSIKYLYVLRNKRLLNTFSRFFITGGLVYLPLVTLNRTTNGDDPIIKESTLYISGGMLLSGFLLKKLNKRKHEISEKRPLKIIDISP